MDSKETKALIDGKLDSSGTISPDFSGQTKKYNNSTGYPIGILIAIHSAKKKTIFSIKGAKTKAVFFDGEFKQLEP